MRYDYLNLTPGVPMSIKQILGSVIIFIILVCTLLVIGGIWGYVEGDTAWQMFYTLVSVAIGLGTAGALIDRYFAVKP